MKSLTKALVFSSGLGAVLTLSFASGCSSTASDSGGTAGSAGTATGGSSTAGSSTAGSSTAGSSTAGTSEGGASDGGTSSTAGSSNNGGTAGEAGAGPLGMAGEAGATSSMAVAKFCNEVAFGTQQAPMDITLRLEVGTPPNVVTFSALTGTCVPIDCKSIPVGTEVPVALFDPSAGDTMLDSVTAAVGDGDQFVFWAAVGDAGGGQMAPLINGGPITDGSSCTAFTYGDLP